MFAKENTRVGLVANKLGMTSFFSAGGVFVPVTVLKVFTTQVLRKLEFDSYSKILVCYGQVKDKNIKKPIKGIYEKLQIPIRKHIKEFKVSKDYFLDDFSTLDAAHFKEGQLVDISGITIGKGFAGGMKRHNFRGLEASHGVSISHRSPGSTGNRQDPGRVFKNKKMAGHMGSRRRTIQNLLVLKIDPAENLIIVKGSIPGSKGCDVVIIDSKKKFMVA